MKGSSASIGSPRHQKGYKPKTVQVSTEHKKRWIILKARSPAQSQKAVQKVDQRVRERSHWKVSFGECRLQRGPMMWLAGTTPHTVLACLWVRPRGAQNHSFQTFTLKGNFFFKGDFSMECVEVDVWQRDPRSWSEKGIVGSLTQGKKHVLMCKLK